MAVDIKVAPDEKLELVQTYITDTNPNSDYFVISELPDTFSGGKNAFLIAGSDKLLANTEVKVQVRDANGNVCYIEFSNGLPTEYYEGNSKVVAVYVYPTLTAFGPATITILGQLKDVPNEWQGLYNVKWERKVNINPALANTTRVRLYKRPLVSIKELLQPLYSIVSGSKVASLVTQSFASITVNQLETFAGDVKRVKVYRTSAGDISDYELIQDISVEAKNILTTYALTGSVVGNAGIFGPDSLSKVWNTGSLYATLNSTYVNDGLELTGSGTLTYTSSLNLLSSNTYELELDTFYTGLTATNLVAYISGTQNGAIPITTFSGSTPTKNFGTTTIPFTIPNDEPTASLYISQSSGTNQWHVGNISLNLSQDTAFSPNEVNFITSMPTVLGNETFNFKFELYDVNNNYVPIAITQSALFTGGNNNVGGTLLLISGSTSASNAAILALSQSVSGTIGIVTGSVSYVSTSVSQSFYTASLISSSVSSSLSQSFGFTSAASASISQSTYYAVTSSVSTSFSYTSASVNSLSQSVSASLSYLSSSVSSSAFTVYSASAYLQKFIFTDANGMLNKPPVTSSAGLYTGQTYLGFYSASQWRTYMDATGHFYLTGSNSNFLAWDGSNLQVQGTINIQGGNAATTSSLNSATASLLTSASAYSTASYNNLSSSLAPNIFTDSTGKIQRPPTVLVNGTSGLFLGSSYLGYYDGNNWKTYMSNTGNFYLSGTGANALSWDGTTLSINGTINVTGGNAATSASVYSVATTSANTAYTNASASAFSNANTAYSNAVSTASGSAYTMATTSANTAYTNASASAYTMATTAANSAYASAKSVADSIANGTYSGGTLITGTSIVSPVIAGADGYFSRTFRVGSGGITLDGVNKVIYVGAGNFNNADTAFYVDNSSNFSLGNQLSWNGSTLSIAGGVQIGGTAASTVVSGAASGANSLQPGTAASDVNNNSTNISGGKIRTGLIQSNNFSGTGDGSDFSTAGTSIDLTGGGVSMPNFRLTSGGSAYFRGNINATGGTFSGDVTAGTVTINTSGIHVSGDLAGIEIAGGRGIYSTNGGGIYLQQTNAGQPGGAFYASSVNGLVTNYCNLRGDGTLILDATNNSDALSLLISAYGTGTGTNIINAYGDGTYSFEGSGFTFKPRTGFGQNLSWTMQSIATMSGSARNLMINSSGLVAQSSSSSRRYKNSIAPMPLEKAKQILEVDAVQFKYNKGVTIEDSDELVYGFIAEEVKDAGLEDTIIYDKDGVVDAIDYGKLNMYLFPLVKDLYKRIEQLEAQLSGSK